MILVAGATGQLGGMITRRLLEQGKEVRILVREGSDHRALVDAGAQRVFGDLKDRASLDAAIAGVETVVTTANSARRGGDDNPQTVEHRGNQNLVEAASAAGVRHFIFTSALGASPDAPDPFVSGKARTEQRLRESGMTYTILAPNIYMEVWVGMVVAAPALQGQEVVYVGSGERRHSMVSVGDVAKFAAAAVDHPAAQDQYLVIAGPEAFSWRDAVAAFERILGRSILHRGVAPGEPVPTVPQQIHGLLAWMDTFDSPIDISETAQTYGVELTPLEDVIRTFVPASA